MEISPDFFKIEQVLCQIEENLLQFEDQEYADAEEKFELQLLQQRLLEQFGDLGKFTKTFVNVVEAVKLAQEKEVEISKALEHEPEIILMDYPTVDIDLYKSSSDTKILKNQRKAFEEERKKPLGERDRLLEELQTTKESLMKAVLENQRLCEKVGVLNNSPIYECSVSLTTFRQKESERDAVQEEDGVEECDPCLTRDIN